MYSNAIRWQLAAVLSVLFACACTPIDNDSGSSSDSSRADAVDSPDSDNSDRGIDDVESPDEAQAEVVAPDIPTEPDAVDEGPRLCPTQPPVAGSVCDTGVDPADCEYNYSVWVECRVSFRCTNDEWWENDWDCDTDWLICPDQPGRDGASCTEVMRPGITGGYCIWDEGTYCYCSGNDEWAQWACTPPPTTAGCPAIPPMLGTACDAGDVSCDYCNGSATRSCQNGVWVRSGRYYCRDE